jgi:Zn finger protein HypA/HybF involved in hydrogenase expression
LDSSGPSATARQKFECPACGADAHWNAAKQALVCPFCGTESPATLQTRGAETVIVEHDLVAALRGIPDAKRGWQAEKVTVKCQNCHAVSVFDPARVGQRCEFCGSSQLVPYEQVKDAFSPESLLPFAVNDRARASWCADGTAAMAGAEQPEERALTDTVHGPLPSVLDLRRAGARELDRRSGPLLLRKPERQAGAEGALVVRLRRHRSFLRR